MKKIFLVMFTLSLFQGSLAAQIIPDSAAIRETVLNHIEGWENGDSARMTKSLHPELAKRGIIPSKNGIGTEMLRASYDDMVTWSAYQKKDLKGDLKPKNEIVILEIGRNIASVTCLSKEFIDYLHLTRTEKGWKILNVIWEPNYTNVVKTKSN